MRRKTREEVAWLEENLPRGTYAEALRLFAGRFGWAPSRQSLASWACERGIGPANRPLRWTTAMDAYFREIVLGHSEAEIAELFEARFGIRLSNSQIGNRKTRLGIRSGTAGGRFEPGHVPANKGRTWDELGISPEAQERSRSTCFKAGDEPPNGAGVAVGAERVSKDGYVQVKVKRFSDRPGANGCWRMKHHLVWEEANGRSVPPSSMIVFADRDNRNFDPANLVCVPRAEWATICSAGLAYRDRESLEAAVLTARLIQRVRKLELGERECRKCGRPFKPANQNQRRCRACIDAGKSASITATQWRSEGLTRKGTRIASAGNSESGRSGNEAQAQDRMGVSRRQEAGRRRPSGARQQHVR